MDNVVLKNIAPSTVGRGKTIRLSSPDKETLYKNDDVSLTLANSLDCYPLWQAPTCIISDGGYGVLGFEGDTSDHLGLPEWYKPHIKAWSERATPTTTLWFWNSEIGWASVHPILEKYGWRYINANIWNKGKGHIAGNVNTAKIRRFPVVTEVCVQYVFEAKIDNKPLKEWLRSEWVRSGLPLRRANEACGVVDAATRKYFDKGHLWYFPPSETFQRLSDYANKYGVEEGKPYYSIDGVNPLSSEQWKLMRSKFNCPHGYTNVWERSSLRNGERIKVNGSSGKAVHLNQKPLDLMRLIIEASTEEGDTVWEPFGGLFSGSLAAMASNRKAFGAEIDSTYYHYGVKRFTEPVRLDLGL